MIFKFCPECGCKFDKEFRFCPECGLNLADFGAIENKEQNKDGASDLSSLESLFDKQIKKREDDDKVYQNRLMAAKILVIKEEYEKAENAYNEILFDVVDDALPYIGLIRAISKNFTVLDEKNVNEQMELLFDLFDKDVCLKADADFKSFYEERELHFLELKEQEEARQEEIKRKEILAERIRKLNEENARKAREREEKARKEAEKRDKELLEQKRKKINGSFALALQKIGKINFSLIDGDTIIIDGMGEMVKSQFGFLEHKRTEWTIVDEDNFYLYLLMNAPDPRALRNETYIVKNIITSWFSLTQLSITKDFDKKRYEEYRAVPGIRLPSKGEYNKYINQLKKITKDKSYVALKKRTSIFISEDGKLLISSCGNKYDEFGIPDNKWSHIYHPVMVIDKERLIDLVLK